MATFPDPLAAAAPPQFSPDRAQFWDGSSWCRLSDDRYYYWDGGQWRLLPWWGRPGVTVDALLSGSYLGGHPDHPDPIKRALLQLDLDGVRVNGRQPSLIFAPWGVVDGLTVEGSDEFRRRAGAGRVLALGVLGYFTASGKYCYVTVSATNGPIHFEVNSMMARELSAQLQFVLHNYTVNAPEQTQAAQDDPYAQLAKLAQLRDGGVISANDFEAKKAELLRRI